MSEKPLATLLVLSYNQEQFIDDAIDGAFAQSYQPLEIVLSDDASTDGTWERIKARADEYEGPHAVHVRRERSNVGTLDHVLNAVSESRGELIVLAAGDDISYPKRIDRLVALWQASGAEAVCSGLDIIDEDGNVLVEGVKGTGGAQPRRWFDYSADKHLIKGCTAAYSRSLFHGVPRSGTRVLHEDIVMNTWLILNEKAVARTEEPLVGYRRNSGSISNAHRGTTFKSWRNSESARVIHSRAYTRLYDYLIDSLRWTESELTPESMERVMVRIRRSRETAKIRTEFYQRTVRERIQAIFDPRYRQERKRLMARLFGPAPYACFKTISSVIPGISRHLLRFRTKSGSEPRLRGQNDHSSRS